MHIIKNIKGFIIIIFFIISFFSFFIHLKVLKVILFTVTNFVINSNFNYFIIIIINIIIII